MTSRSIPPGVPTVHLRSANYGVFLYKRMIQDVVGDPEDGDIVAVLDKEDKFFGWAFYNSRSQITLRMFSHEFEMPTEKEIARRISEAVKFRRDVLQLDRTTDVYRLIHAEGDGLSGLIADKLGDYIVIELFSQAMSRRLELIEDAIVDAKVKVHKFVVRADKTVCAQEGFHLGKTGDHKERDKTTVVHESGVKFAVNLQTGHKTGFFCDQRENRLALTEFTAGKTMLDICCYTGGFSCYAAAHGKASSVTAVDLDENSLELARKNAELNGVKIQFQHADAFDFLRGQGDRQWDIVVVDPSKFVPDREMMETGLRKYNDLNKLAAKVVKKGGILLTCSCSGLVDIATFVKTIAKGSRASGRSLKIFRITGASSDHPVMADTPESAYLKAVWCRVE